MKALLDEMFPPRLAEQLRERGHDAESLYELGAAGRPDHEVLRLAVEGKRAVVTEDAGDYAVLAKRYEAEGLPHHGIVLVPARRFPRTTARLGHLTRALDTFMHDHRGADALAGTTVWLG